MVHFYVTWRALYLRIILCYEPSGFRNEREIMCDLETLRSSAALGLITRKRANQANHFLSFSSGIYEQFHTRGGLIMGKIPIYFERFNLPKRRGTIRMKTCCGCSQVLH